MGADLFLMSLHEPPHKKWEPRFEAAIAERNRHAEGTREYKRAQKRAMRCYERMFGQGYFRDPYNHLDVLWKFGLSWWGDVIPMLDSTACLPVAETKRFLQMLHETPSGRTSRGFPRRSRNTSGTRQTNSGTS